MKLPGRLLGNPPRDPFYHHHPAKLTDRFIANLPPAPAGKRTAVWDEAEPGLAIVVTDRGSKSFKVVKRVGGGSPKAGRAAWRVRVTRMPVPALVVWSVV